MTIINCSPDKINNTSFFGDIILASCNQLKFIFGDYQESDPAKVNYEWRLFVKEKEIPFTIYDWKESSLKEDDIIWYHIGARNSKESRMARDLVNEYLKNYRLNGINN